MVSRSCPTMRRGSACYPWLHCCPLATRRQRKSPLRSNAAALSNRTSRIDHASTRTTLPASFTVRIAAITGQWLASRQNRSQCPPDRSVPTDAS
jgi:hypothetical protein